MANDGIEATGKTVEDAIDAALERLGAREDEVEIKILAEGGPRGILGRKVDPARVWVRLRDERDPQDIALEREELGYEGLDAGAGAQREPEGSPPPSPEELEEQGGAAEEFLRGLLDVLGLEGEIEVHPGTRAVAVDVSGPEMGLLIGRHGSTLEAAQELVRAAVQRKLATRARVNLDVEGYRARQRSQLERRARDVAARVRRSRRAVTLEPMSAFSRKIIHDALSRFSDITTTSEGEEPNRRVVVRPKGGTDRGGGSRRDGGPRGGRARGRGGRVGRGRSDRGASQPY